LLTFPDHFQIFCEHKVFFNDPVKLYDPLLEKFEVYMDTNEVGRMVLFGFCRYVSFYGLSSPCFLHLHYVGNNTFLHRIFSTQGIEIVYKRYLTSASNTQVQVGFADCEKILSIYDDQASSLVWFIFIVMCL